ncbi:EAL domain-containing protein (putative c-di-GMP-specific phosphodiesterase class I) [Nakamurella sp. UYEF19]|uniref:sensor domain-containing phosphodiesterase n=1 Tax=Nakamurella sp. UYEF19 TaxID=1756392 RepID=UPI0033934C0C
MTTEKQRLQGRSAAHYFDDGPASARLQTTVALTARTLGFPTAMINILDTTTRHTINLIGAGGGVPLAREEVLCDVVVNSGRPLEVPDARADPRFADLPSVVRGEIGCYIGVPLAGRESFIVGALCVIDPRPHDIDPDVANRLMEFGRIVEDQLDLVRRLDEQRIDGELAVAELAEAIAQEQIVPWYQPIVDLPSGRTVGFEALARWQHPSGEMHDPRRFVPLAEDTDLIVDLDLLVMRRAVADLRRWQEINPDLRVNVNLSSRHFNIDESAAAINDAVLKAGVSPEAVDLEITETTRLNPVRAAQVLGELREAGFGVWLDDFGTGWSALDYLLRLPVSGVKIDRAVSIALGSRLGNALTRAVTGLASELQLVTTIEGIEKPEHAALAYELGCNYAQGYLWSPPQPAGAVDDALNTPGPTHRA